MTNKKTSGCANTSIYGQRQVNRGKCHTFQYRDLINVDIKN